MEGNRNQDGFTIVEVIVAIFLILIGVLGTVTMIDGANATTTTTKQREGATNLAREIVEVARAVDYDKLNQTEAPGELQSRPGLSDSSGSSGWQVERRGTTYTVGLSACTFDDGKDNAGSHTINGSPDPSFCSNSATAPTGDDNPDDYRKLDLTVSWQRKGGTTLSVPQTAVVNNPSGGLGPRITSFDCGTCSVLPGETTLGFSATTTSAESLEWSADDGISTGALTAGPTSWSWSWDLKPVGSFACGSQPDWVLDGTYVVSAQAFDIRGIPGNLRTAVVTIDRSAPAEPCGLAGGRNNPPEDDGTGYDEDDGIVDLEWLPNAERDIERYELHRVQVGSETADRLVCVVPAGDPTECIDDDPPDPGSYPVLLYYVVAHDANLSTASDPITIQQSGNATRPTEPGNLSASVVDGLPKLSWNASSDADTGDMPIRYYRIYKGGSSYADRWDKVPGDQLSYTDKRAQGTGDQYWVTAVDQRFQESLVAGPVTP